MTDAAPLPLDSRLAALGLRAPVTLAPMAGITDRPFRDLVRRFGAGLVVSEMVASREMVEAKPSVRARAELGGGAEGAAVQIAGRDAHWMAEAARMVAGEGARVIDINMGCPAKKVTGGLSGSALLRDHDHALRLIEAVVGAVDVPVTLKTRLGWDDESRDTAALARRAEAAGVAMLAIHGRTRCQFYRGKADWAGIRPIVDAVSIPVLANGDVRDHASAREALRLSGAAGVMVGRAAGGAPWLLAEIAGSPAPAPTGAALAALAVEHLDASMRFYGEALGARVARKHLGWYMDRAATPPAVRRRVLTAAPRDAAALLWDALAPAEARAA
ncbi:tRNA dihydrouridine synthase DusB [Jannaschia sp. W003]|uniref:tRNA dihydrouridine synthase DusB n=1 Tax=Jannaschia sp. W003 TaxID=2867012 RepID=UPI0021A61C69|nr:tRNA dihydrouridine synthase DusB [Jannaschia sp. W003]UWQ20492.1 tRNA dihydrouridine synthase DusB [Jannaschia sp. W003]